MGLCRLEDAFKIKEAVYTYSNEIETAKVASLDWTGPMSDQGISCPSNLDLS